MDLALSDTSSEDGQVHLQNLCRMCAVKADKTIAIFGPEGIQHELAVKMQTHLPVKISESDTLPLQLCFDCTSLLIQWDAALVGSLAADRKLRALQWKQQQMARTKEKEAEQKEPEESETEQIETEPKLAEDCSKSKEENKKSTCSKSKEENRKDTCSKSKEENRKDTAPKSSNESLCCSICNRSGMDFRELILHLKNHEPAIPNDKQKDTLASSNSSNISENNPVLVDRSDGNSGENQLKLSGKHGSPESQKQTKGKRSKVIPEPVQNGEDSVKSRLRKRKGKPSDSPKNAPEIGSGDPQVTSSTGTPPFKTDTSGNNTLLQTLNGREKRNGSTKSSSTTGELAQKDEQQLQNGGPKPKVRIISAENINLSLEQRAKANLSAKPTESDTLKITPVAASSKSPASASEKLASLPVNSKNKIVISSEIMKQIGNIRSKPGPKLLRLRDGRIVRLLDTAPTVSPLSNSYQRIYRPIMPCSVKDASHQSQSQSRSVLLKAAPPLQPTITNVISVSEKSFSLDSGTNSVSLIQSDDDHITIPISSPVTQAGDSTVAVKVEPSERTAAPQILTEKRMVNVSFHPQPGPKHSVPRFTCFQCGKRNLLHDALHAHAQTHAPDKAVLNAVSVPRSFSPVVASSIIRVVSNELKSKAAVASSESSKCNKESKEDGENSLVEQAK